MVRRRWSSLSVAPVMVLTIIGCTTTLIPTAQGKKVSGSVQLSGVNTEVLLASFAVSGYGAKLEGTLVADHMYENERGLQIRAYRDTDWPAFRKATLCTEKIKLAQRTLPVSFRQSEEEGEGPNKEWQANLYMQLANIGYVLDNSNNSMEEQKKQAQARNHYWYFVLDDCSLEEYYHDSRIPRLHYELHLRNYQSMLGQSLTHLSADQSPLLQWHGVSMAISTLVCLWLLAIIYWRLSSTNNSNSSSHQSHSSIHAAVVWVATAAAFDSSSSFWQICHLERYHNNGIGWYSADALSAHLEACCDASLMIFLLSMAAGWTLPSSVVPVVHTTNGTLVQKLLVGFSHPIATGFWQVQGNRRITPAGVLTISVVALHFVLAQWGRTYNDDFESYHHLEHLPGRILMAVRVLTGLFFVVAVQHTRTSSKCTVALRRFYTVFGVTGTVWFVSLPALTWFGHWFLPYHLRLGTVCAASAFLQCSMLVVLAWLVTTHSTAYHQYSRMTNSRETLEESLGGEPTSLSSNVAVGSGPASPKAWHFGKKSKVRLD